ncbi:MAG: hypothetical protein J4431_00870 [Candidatus Aenigmarchaeota archaeon]|nr:hypothetical protein [Candidatus Aenigmarchaeota archaeon]
MAAMNAHANVLASVTHAPAPAPSCICAKNAMPVRSVHMNHEKACGFVLFVSENVYGYGCRGQYGMITHAHNE